MTSPIEHDQTDAAVSASRGYLGYAGNKTLAKIVIAFVVFHLLMTAAYLLPTPGPIRSSATRYIEPVFKQSWWVFAPDPVSSNVYLSVRATKNDGTQTPWFGITRCDIDSAIHHHPVPNRRYLSSFQLMRHYELGRDNLPKAAQEALHHDVTGTDWRAQLKKQLVDAGAAPARTDTFLKSGAAMNNLTSLVAHSRWGDDLRSVQVQIATVHTRPFAQRHTDTPLRSETWQSGRTPYTTGSGTERDTVAALYGPQGGC